MLLLARVIFSYVNNSTSYNISNLVSFLTDSFWLHAHTGSLTIIFKSSQVAASISFTCNWVNWPAQWQEAWCARRAGSYAEQWWRGKERDHQVPDEESAWVALWTAPTDRWTRETLSTSPASHARSLSYNITTTTTTTIFFNNKLTNTTKCTIVAIHRIE